MHVISWRSYLPPLPIGLPLHIAEQFLESIGLVGVNWHHRRTLESLPQFHQIGDRGMPGCMTFIQWDAVVLSDQSRSGFCFSSFR